MRYPAFIAEMGAEQSRRKLLLGVYSGYGIAVSLGSLALFANVRGVMPWRGWIYALVAMKLATNTAALGALRTRRGVLEWSALNITVDLITMTGAIYLTGDVQSPLFAIYVIEITVIALLTNLGITILMAGAAHALYSGMVLFVHFGVLPRIPPPVQWLGGAPGRYVLFELLFAAFALGAPTFYVAAILRLLRSKNARLEERTRQLIDAGRERNQFMANITHELRTPLQGIMGLSDLVDAGIYGETTEKQREAMAGIKRSSQSLLGLIDDLLTLARMDAGRIEMRVADVDLREVMTGVASAVEWMKGLKRIDVSQSCADDIPTISTDRAKLAQVLLNLVSNAVKFTPEDGKITLRAERAGEQHVRIVVEDTGIGLEKDQLARIFEAFHQVDPSASREFGGAGLGLALVSRLCRLLGAMLEVESSPGVGSTFTVLLPLAVQRDSGSEVVPGFEAPGDRIPATA